MLTPGWEPLCYNTTCPITTQHSLFTLLGGDDSDDEEEVDSNNDGGSLQSERTDKDEEACEGKPQALSRRPTVDLLTANKLWLKVLKIASWH